MFGTFRTPMGDYSVAICKNCLASVILTPSKHTTPGRNILVYLDSAVSCCQTPNYHFYPVYSYPEGEKEPTKEDKPVMDKFWMVIKAEGGSGSQYTRQRHPRYSDARHEAERLCRQNNAAYVVLEAVEVCSPKETPSPVTWDVIQ